VVLVSSEAVGYVFRHSPYTGALFTIHYAVADSVNDQYSNEFWMKSKQLARKARLNEVTARASLSVLVTDGFLEVVKTTQGGGRRPTRYRFLFPPRPIVFDSREKMVSSQTTPREGGVVSDTDGVVSDDTHRTQTEPKLKASNEAPKVQKLVGEYIDASRAQGYEPTKKRIARVGSETKRLLGDGVPERALRGALKWIADENKTPAALEYLAAEIQKEIRSGKV
jgi:hypothetical protein